jgi:ADP-ribosylglycohydrolase
VDLDRARGALLGLAVGDAVGTTVEFSPPGTFAPLVDMVGGGPFNLPAGAWTDDTSMALCLADSLIERGGFDPVDQLERYLRWYREGHRSSTGSCFDIGGATRAALERFERTGEPFPGDAAPTAAGNGPLMKLAPVVLAFASDPDQAVRYAGESARTTHGAPEAIDACRYFAALLLEVEPPRDLHPKIAELPLDREPPAVRGGGYIVDALEAALWALRSTSSFEAAVLAAANLGDDADTTAAICGQLAGVRYGLGGIPAHWRSRVFLGDEIVALADRLVTT